MSTSESSDSLPTQDNTAPRRAERPTRKEAAPTSGRSPDRNQSRKWAEQDRYMRIALEKIDLTEAQLSRITDMNWEHFINLEKKKSERPSVDDAVVEMLETGTFSPETFLAESTYLKGIEALLESQFKERMSTLHEVLNKKQRTELATLVEADERKQYASEDKQTVATGGPMLPPGCGDLIASDRMFNRLVDEESLTKAQRRQAGSIRAELNKDKPDAAQWKDLQQAGRIYDMAVRKAFTRSRFDLGALHRPQKPLDDPAALAACKTNAMEALFKMLTPTDRAAAAARFKNNRARKGNANEQTSETDS